MAFSFDICSQQGILSCGGNRVRLKGVNWFGFETSDFVLHGLWSRKLAWFLDLLQSQRVNALRIPFSAEWALQADTLQSKTVNYYENPDLEGKTSGQIFDAVISGCAERGILILLDMHRLAATDGISELWYNENYTESKVLEAWIKVLQRCNQFWNILGADLKNEPHGPCSWGDDNVSTDWRLAAERIGKSVQEVAPRLLIFVEGINCGGVVPPTQAAWWGGCVASAASAPVRLPINHKLVLSPHVYGPGVFAQPYFQDRGFPGNLRDIWEQHWACVKRQKLGPAIVVGEWGGFAAEGTPDNLWHKALVSYLNDLDITDTFYWCLNPNSGDTGGLLADDWQTLVSNKWAFLHQVCKQPTQFQRVSNYISVDGAQFQIPLPS